MMKFLPDINIKALVFGAAIAAAFILFGYQINDWLYPFSAIGLLYIGYGQDSIKKGAILGALGATPIVVLTLQGYMGTFSGFFVSETGILTVTAVILIVGAFVGLVGAWTKVNRMKALAEYEKKQKIGKNKNSENDRRQRRMLPQKS